MLFLKRPISDLSDAIAGKPPPTGFAFSQSLSFCPPFCASSGLVYNDERGACATIIFSRQPVLIVMHVSHPPMPALTLSPESLDAMTRL